MKEREDLIVMLGGYNCASRSCPIPPELLIRQGIEIDHIDDDGNTDRKRFVTTNGHFSCQRFYLYYLSHPDEAKVKLQVLCIYCNRIKKLIHDQKVGRPLQRKSDTVNALSDEAIWTEKSILRKWEWLESSVGQNYANSPLALNHIRWGNTPTPKAPFRTIAVGKPFYGVTLKKEVFDELKQHASTPRDSMNDILYSLLKKTEGRRRR